MNIVFLGSPRNERAANSCRLSQAKGRISVLIVNEKSNHWRWIHEWLKRQNEEGDIHLWQQKKYNQTSPKSYPLKQIFWNHIQRIDSSLMFGPLTWTICSIHSDIPGCIAVVSILLTSWGSLIFSRKVTRSGLETTRPVHQRKEYLFC